MAARAQTRSEWSSSSGDSCGGGSSSGARTQVEKPRGGVSATPLSRESTCGTSAASSSRATIGAAIAIAPVGSPGAAAVHLLEPPASTARAFQFLSHQQSTQALVRRRLDVPRTAGARTESASVAGIGMSRVEVAHRRGSARCAASASRASHATAGHSLELKKEGQEVTGRLAVQPRAPS